MIEGFYHRVWCKHCKIENIEKARRDSGWHRNLFLGKNCQHCGEYLPWVSSYGRWVRNCFLNYLNRQHGLRDIHGKKNTLANYRTITISFKHEYEVK